MKNKTLRNDLILVGVLLGVLLLAGAVWFLLQNEGDSVVVTVNGQVHATYPLNRDTEVDILTGESQEQFNRLVIKDGKAYVQSASCPDGICASHKPISREGESIICLPNKVVISVETEK